MKKHIKYIIASLAIVAVSVAAELVLSSATKSGGVTTTVTVGRVQGEPAADGTIVLTVIPREIVKLGDGTVVSDKFLNEWLSVKLTAEQLDSINAAITKASEDAAKAKVAAVEEKP